MKKYLLAFIFVLGLGISAKGMDPLYVKNHGSEILKDQQWHTLAFKLYSNCNTAEISIRQKSADDTYIYEFTGETEKVMFKFYNWLDELGDYYFDIKDISMEKNLQGEYIGEFRSSKFVPDVDKTRSFVGIDMFK